MMPHRHPPIQELSATHRTRSPCHTDHVPTVNVFNPRILDASIRDVTAALSDEQKADIVLYAMGHLKPERSRTLVENAVQSCLLIEKLPPATATKARLMRAKARLAAGQHVGAHQDLQAILVAEPDHAEARALLNQHVANPVESYGQAAGNPSFSTEIWREIALWLPPRDLKSLLLVPHVLSRIASQLLFSKIDLHFASDKWESQRSADILTRIIVDPTFAVYVKTLRIFVPGRDSFPMSFQTGMLANAIPKLINLRNVHCAMRWKDMQAFLKILETITHRLYGLSLAPSDGAGDMVFPRFKHLLQLSYSSNGGAPQHMYEFLAQNKNAVRSLHLQNPTWIFPSESISIRNLTHLDFLGLFPADSHAFADILEHGHQLESLRLQCVLECNASAQFREYNDALPFLRHFAFSLIGYRVNDHDLFPAVSDFLRDRRALRTLHLTVPSADWAQKRLGYDAKIWGILPSLTNLRSLTATLPMDVAPPVAMWLLPRGVRALSLHAVPSSTANALDFVTQLRPGLPGSLRFIGLSGIHVEDVAAVIEQGFPIVRLARLNGEYYTVSRERGKLRLEEWPQWRTQYCAREWLESLGCEDADWRDPTDFL